MTRITGKITSKWSIKNKNKRFKWMSKKFCMVTEVIEKKLHICMRPKEHKGFHLCGECSIPMFMARPKALNRSDDNISIESKDSIRIDGKGEYTVFEAKE